MVSRRSRHQTVKPVKAVKRPRAWLCRSAAAPPRSALLCFRPETRSIQLRLRLARAPHAPAWGRADHTGVRWPQAARARARRAGAGRRPFAGGGSGGRAARRNSPQQSPRQSLVQKPVSGWARSGKGGGRRLGGARLLLLLHSRCFSAWAAAAPWFAFAEPRVSARAGRGCYVGSNHIKPRPREGLIGAHSRARAAPTLLRRLAGARPRRPRSGAGVAAGAGRCWGSKAGRLGQGGGAAACGDWVWRGSAYRRRKRRQPRPVENQEKLLGGRAARPRDVLPRGRQPARACQCVRAERGR